MASRTILLCAVIALLAISLAGCSYNRSDSSTHLAVWPFFSSDKTVTPASVHNEGNVLYFINWSRNTTNATQPEIIKKK